MSSDTRMLFCWNETKLGESSCFCWKLIWPSYLHEKVGAESPETCCWFEMFLIAGISKDHQAEWFTSNSSMKMTLFQLLLVESRVWRWWKTINGWNIFQANSAFGAHVGPVILVKKTSGSGVAPGPYVDALNFGMVSGGGMTVSLVFPVKISAPVTIPALSKWCIFFTIRNWINNLFLFAHACTLFYLDDQGKLWWRTADVYWKPKQR